MDFNPLLGMVCGLFVFDMIENMFYLFAPENLAPIIYGLKFTFGFFALALLLFAFVVYIKKLREKSYNVLDEPNKRVYRIVEAVPVVFRYNTFSVIIILAVFVLLLKFAQGGSIMMALLTNPFQIGFCLIYITILVFLIWNTPVELFNRKEPDLKLNGMSLDDYKLIVRDTRRFLALIFLLGLIYVCSTILQLNWTHGRFISPLAITLGVGILFAFLYRRVNKTYKGLRNPSKDSKSNSKSPLLIDFCCDHCLILTLGIYSSFFFVPENALCIRLFLFTAILILGGCFFIGASPRRSHTEYPQTRIRKWIFGGRFKKQKVLVDFSNRGG